MNTTACLDNLYLQRHLINLKWFPDAISDSVFGEIFFLSFLHIVFPLFSILRGLTYCLCLSILFSNQEVVRNLEKKKNVNHFQFNSHAKKDNNQSGCCNIQHTLHSKRTIKLPATLYSDVLLPAIMSIISAGTLCLITYFCGIWAWNVYVFLSHPTLLLNCL